MDLKIVYLYHHLTTGTGFLKCDWGRPENNQRKSDHLLKRHVKPVEYVSIFRHNSKYLYRVMSTIQTFREIKYRTLENLYLIAFNCSIDFFLQLRNELVNQNLLIKWWGCESIPLKETSRVSDWSGRVLKNWPISNRVTFTITAIFNEVKEFLKYCFIIHFYKQVYIFTSTCK